MTLTLGSLQQKERQSRKRLSALQKKLQDPSLSPQQKKVLRWELSRLSLCQFDRMVHHPPLDHRPQIVEVIAFATTESLRLLAARLPLQPDGDAAVDQLRLL